MAKKGRPNHHDDMEEEEELELDDGVMQELLHDDDNSSSCNEDNDDPSNNISDNGDTPRYIYNYTPSRQQLLQQKSLNAQKMKEDVEAINDAATQLFHVIKKYGGHSTTSPPSSSGWDEILTAKNNPWKDDDNVDTALDEIVAARNNMVQAWDRFHNDSSVVDRDGKKTMNDDGEQSKMEWWEPILRSRSKLHDNGDDNNNNNIKCSQANDDNDDNNVDEQQFHQVYMEYATNAFATELEALRKGQLEQMCTNSKKKMGGSTNNSGKATSSQPMELDLDPTQHSFVVASSKRSGNDDDNDDGAKAAAAAAEIDVQVLSDMLSSGSHTLSIVERNMLLRARQRGNSSSGGAVVLSTSEGLSLHERRRQELGLLADR